MSENHMNLREDNETALKNYLGGFNLFAENTEEGVNYLNAAFRRFMITLRMVPPASLPESKLLELGANPYFLTLLLQRFRTYHLTLSNFFRAGHSPDKQGIQVISNASYHERWEFAYDHFNVEKDVFPYPDREFDIVLFCETLEHLVIDPTHTLNEIQRVLKPGGYMVLTTPNVLACQNFLKLAIGQNIYDCYSGYGIYGRHNREYTPQEVVRLLKACGFEIVRLRLEDVYPHSKLFVRLLKKLRRQWRDNIFILARASDVSCFAYPSSLYRSMPESCGGIISKNY